MSTWDDKPNDYEHALDEIEQLRDDLGAALVRENNLLAILVTARPYVQHCAEPGGSDVATVVLREIDALVHESE